MAGRPLSLPRLLAAVADQVRFQPAPEIDRRGRVLYSGDELLRILHIYKPTSDRAIFTWEVSIVDGKYRDRPTASGIWLGVRVPSTLEPVIGLRRAEYPWPASADSLPEKFLADIDSCVVPALSFVADRRELAALLLRDGDEHRGEIHAELSASTSPARLVQALILALDLGDDRMVHDVMAKLQRMTERDSDYGKTVAYWVKQYGPHIDVDLSGITKIQR